MSDLNPGPLAPPSAPVRFGPAGRFELQPLERRLLVDGQPASLGARALDVLITLVSQPDHLVTKDELLDRVWSGLVVEEANLQMQISNLRKVLGGDAIATVPGRGYRFVSPVMAPPGAGPVPASPAMAAAAQPPRAAPRLIGRDADLARLEALLGSGACATLVGPAGVGKTSLARAAAARVAGRSTWVDLAPLTQADQLGGALARALQVPLSAGAAAPQLLRALQNPLQAQPGLVVLDNAEHLVQACAEWVTLLRGVAGLQLLVTSQLPLALAGEQVQRLEPLALPEARPAALGDGALALLVERIVAADHRFSPGAAELAVLSDICQRLDGLPLALEMAAARVPLMGLQAVRDALAQRFALLTRGHRDAAARHRTLHNALDWSYRLLSADEQRLFRALGVFAGGFTLELAVAVMGAGSGTALGQDSPARWAVIDGLAALVDRSLVAFSAEDPPRYRLLDTMRAYALQDLAASPGELAAVRQQHAIALADLFWRYTPGDTASQVPYLAEIDNAREAVTWARVHDLDRAARISARAARISTFSVWRHECTQWLRDLQAAMDSPAGAALPAEVQAAWWTELARTASFAGEAQARTAARRALALWQPLQQPAQALFAAVVWVRAIAEPGDELDQACAALQAQASALPDPSVLQRFWVQGALTRAALTRGDYAAALAGRQAEKRLAQVLGSDDMVETAESGIVYALLHLQRPAEAAEQGLALLGRIDGRNGDANGNLPWVLVGLLEALIETGRLDEARALVPRTCAAGRRFATTTILPVLPLLAAAQGRFDAAARLIGHVRHRIEQHRVTLDPSDEHCLARAQAAATAALGAAQVELMVEQGRLLANDAAEALAAG